MSGTQLATYTLYKQKRWTDPVVFGLAFGLVAFIIGWATILLFYAIGITDPPRLPILLTISAPASFIVGFIRYKAICRLIERMENRESFLNSEWQKVKKGDIE